MHEFGPLRSNPAKILSENITRTDTCQCQFAGQVSCESDTTKLEPHFNNKKKESFPMSDFYSEIAWVGKANKDQNPNFSS